MMTALYVMISFYYPYFIDEKGEVPRGEYSLAQVTQSGSGW